MDSNSNFVCEKCSYPAASATIFRNKESLFQETPNCPKCNNTEITTRKLSKFKKGWRIIIESGLKEEVEQIPGAYLQLAEKGENRIELGNMKMKDVPPTIAIKLQAKIKMIIVKKEIIVLYSRKMFIYIIDDFHDITNVFWLVPFNMYIQKMIIFQSNSDSF